MTHSHKDPSFRMPQPEDAVKPISGGLFDAMIKEAHNSPRKRINFNFHADLSENPHRFLNVMLRGTYVAPHRHLHPPKVESFLVLKGRLAFFIFNDEGKITEKYILGEGALPGIDIRPGVWHTLAVLDESAVCFEVKPGPYDPTEDKEFASWAPAEGSEGALNYLATLLKE